MTVQFDPDYEACADDACGAVWPKDDGPVCPSCGGPALAVLAATEPAPEVPTRLRGFTLLRDGQLAEHVGIGTRRVVAATPGNVAFYRDLVDTTAPDPSAVDVIESMAAPSAGALTWIVTAPGHGAHPPRDRQGEGPPSPAQPLRAVPDHDQEDL